MPYPELLVYEEVRFEVVTVPDALSDAFEDRFVLQQGKFGNDTERLLISKGNDVPLAGW